MSEDGFTRITLRLPDELHSRLTKAASKRATSMNSEIVQRLESTFTAPADLPVSGAILDDMIRTTERLNRMTVEMDKYQERFEAALKEITEAKREPRRKEKA